MESKTNTFILSDESVNSYGYRVLTAGMSLSRFKRNPVMLYSHDDMVLPIGRWENVRVDGGRILADAVFDEGDDFAVEVKRKVDAGLLRCCSIGFMIKTVADGADGVPEVTESELMEGSICAVGSNPNARKLSGMGSGWAAGPTRLKAGCRCKVTHGETDKRMTVNNLKTSNEMNEQEQARMEQLESQVAQLTQENQSLTSERDTLRDTVRAAREAEIEGLLSAAVQDGRIEESGKEAWRALLTADLENAKKSLQSLHARQSLSAVLEEQKGKGEYAGRSWDELDKAGLLSGYKQNDPEGFKALYKRTFGVEYKG